MNCFCLSRWRSGQFALLLMLVSTCSLGTAVHAQTLRIKLVNGRNGRPIGDRCVNVWVGNAQKDAMAIPTDKNGVATLRLADNENEIHLQNRYKGCGFFGVTDPVVKYSDSLRINAGFVLCQPHRPDYSWLSIQAFSIQDVLRSGVVTPNTCGTAEASPEPGELTLFVRPLTFWETLKE
jgi:hypothetical protein